MASFLRKIDTAPLNELFYWGFTREEPSKLIAFESIQFKAYFFVRSLTANV